MSVTDTRPPSRTAPAESDPGIRAAPAPRQSEKVPARLIGAIFATAALSFLGLLLETVVNVLFPALMSEFGIGMASVSWMTSGYLLVISVVMPLSGYLQRRFTARSLFSVAVVLVTVGSIAAALAPTYPVLLGGRLLQGAGTGIATPLMFTLILTQAPRAKVGSLMGIGALVLGIAPALGPTFGGIIDTLSGWRTVFWLTLPVLAAAAIVGSRCIRQSAPTAAEPLGKGQLVLMALGMIGTILGIERLGAALAAGTGAAGLVPAVVILAAGLACLVGFAGAARRSDTPLIHLAVLRDRRFTLSLLAFALFQFATLGVGYLLPTYAQLGLGESTLVAGLIGLPGAVIGAVFAPLGGMLLDRLGARRPILSGAAIALIGALTLALVGTRVGLIGVSACHFVFMFGFGLAFANTQTNGMSGIDRRLTADGTALMNTAQQFFGSLAMTVLSSVMAFRQAGLSIGSAAYLEGTTSATTTGFVLVAVAVGLTACMEFAVFRGAGARSGGSAQR